MKELRHPMFFALLAFVLVVAGCEWEGAGSSGTWNDAYGWVDFSGVYKPGSGKTYVVSTYAPGEATASTLVEGSDTLGTGNVIESTFSGVLSHVPISLGSISITDGTETFVDSDGDGQLTGNFGGIGALNYQTGAVTVTFKLGPGTGHSIIATYMYFVEGSTENPSPGSSVEIFALTMSQQGNVLSFTDSNGGTYSGNISGVSAATGGGTNLVVSTTIIANFEASGTDSRGQQVTIVGAFYGDYTVSGEMTGVGTLANRIIQGTWMEAGGQTGDLYGEAGGTATIASSTSNTTYVPWWWW